MKRKISFGLFIFFLIGQLSLPVFSLAAEPITGLKKVSEFKADDLLNLLNSKIDIKSFLGKPVKIPLTFEGGATDSIYLVPPQFFIDQKTQKITVTPTRTMYLADGKSVSEEKIKFVRDELEKELNKIMAEKKDLIEQLRAALLNQSFSKEQLQAKFKIKLDPEQSSWLEWFLPFVKAEDDINANTNIDIDALQQLLTQTQTSTGTATEGLTEDDALAEIISSDNPKSRELLSLLLLLLIYKNAIAEADNTDKTTCLAKGGEWIAEKCAYPETEAVSADEKKTCTESGGEWKSDFSQRKICMAFCGATDDGCTDKILEEKIGRSGCICPTGQCVTAAGDCLAQDDSKKDKDEDEIPDSVDKCPNTKDQGDGVNLNESSADYGCSCADLQAKGRIQQRQCPGGGCDGAYLVQYNQSSGTDSCQNGVISQFNCVANRYPSQQCQPPQNNNNNQNQNKNDNNSWQDMLKDLMGNKDNGNGGGQQGGGQQGGGDQGQGGCQNCGPQGSPSQQQKPGQQQQVPSSIEQTIQGIEAHENVQSAITDFYNSGDGIIKNSTDAANFSEAMENYSKAHLGATKEQIRDAANQWVSDNLAPGDKVSPAERAEIYKQIEKATTGANGTKTEAKDNTGWGTVAGAGKEPSGPIDPILAQNAENIKKLGNPNASNDPEKANFEGPTVSKEPLLPNDNDYWGKMDAEIEAEAYGKVQDAYDSGRITDTQAIDIEDKFMRGELSSSQIDQAINQAQTSLPANPADDPGWGSYNDTNFSPEELKSLEAYYTGLGMSPEEIKELIDSFLSEEAGPGDPKEAKEQEDKAPGGGGEEEEGGGGKEGGGGETPS